MRLLAATLVALLVLIQYPLWLGKGGWLQVWRLDRQQAAQHVRLAELQHRNELLAAEVRDLRGGYDAIEERARHDLGLIKADEMFFKFDAPIATTPATVPAGKLGAERAGR
jgi:cell division protein FtsB